MLTSKVVVQRVVLVVVVVVMMTIMVVVMVVVVILVLTLTTASTGKVNKDYLGSVGNKKGNMQNFVQELSGSSNKVNVRITLKHILPTAGSSPVTYNELIHCGTYRHSILVEQMTQIFVFGPHSPHWAMASSFTRLLDHTQRRTTVGRTPLDE
jgi:hypothetical protein